MDTGNAVTRYGFTGRGFHSVYHIPKNEVAPTFDTENNSWRSPEASIEAQTIDFVFVATAAQLSSFVKVDAFEAKDYKTVDGISVSDHAAVYSKVSTACVGN